MILATGVVDRLPVFDGLESAIAGGVLRLCAVCDAYEARDDAIAVLGPGAVAVDHARFLRTFSRRVTALDSTGIGPGDADLRQRAEAAGIALRGAPTSLGLRDGRCHVVFGDGSTECFDTLYPVLGADAQSALTQSMETTMEANGELRVDVHMQTSVDGLYAVGDVVSGLNQISVAVGQAALAATAIHQRLPSNPC